MSYIIAGRYISQLYEPNRNKISKKCKLEYEKIKNMPNSLEKYKKCIKN